MFAARSLPVLTRAGLVGGAFCLIAAASVGAQPAPAQPAASTGAPAVTAFVRNWTRVEAWRYFEPPPGGGDPTYAHLANRIQFGLQRDARKYAVVAALQYVQFGALPDRASGPGPLGTGALYFGHAGRSDSRQVYLRYLHLQLKDLGPGLDVQVGRMAYASGAEAASKSPTIEAVKRQRVDSRLIGEFEWSIYQRGYDGVRLDVDRPDWHVTAAAFRPTQGGFEDAAGAEMKDIDLFVGALNFRPGRVLAGTDLQVFAYRYGDRRPVRARPDNSGRGASGVDVGVNSFGVTAVGAYPTRAGEADLLVWVVGQGGSWYRQPHGAYALAVEGGHQWPDVAWQPWLRVGYARASGDEDPADDRHGTFFQMLPTGRKYSLSATYALMNLTDLFAQAFLRPSPPLRLRIDVHRVGLAASADWWYFGSGATQQSGTIFGYGMRPSRGATSLGTVVEGSADYTINRHWAVNGYVGFIKGGDVVRGSFAGDRLTFAYLEQVLRF